MVRAVHPLSSVMLVLLVVSGLVTARGEEQSLEHSTRALRQSPAVQVARVQLPLDSDATEPTAEPGQIRIPTFSPFPFPQIDEMDTQAPVPDVEPILVDASTLCERCPEENNCTRLCSCETGECFELGFALTQGRPVSANTCSNCRPRRRCRRFHWCR